MVKLTEHFTLEEFTRSTTAIRRNINNNLPYELMDNITRLAQKLEEVRALLGSAIHITSGYRCVELNRLIKSSDLSQHVKGCAADFVIKNMEPHNVCKMIIASGIEFDQLISEFGSWTHISVPATATTKPRMQALIIDSNGTRAFT